MRQVPEKPGEVVGNRIEKDVQFFGIRFKDGVELGNRLKVHLAQTFLQTAFENGPVRRGEVNAAFIVDEDSIAFEIFIGKEFCHFYPSESAAVTRGSGSKDPDRSSYWKVYGFDIPLSIEVFFQESRRLHTKIVSA